MSNDPANPETVSARPLPTTQIDGVAWDQVVVGNTVYVAGEFTTARPAGSAPGVNTVPRANLLAYDIRTGQLLTTWAPTTNASVLSIAAAPDGSRIYIGGTFTTVNGAQRGRAAALDPSTGALVAGFNPNPDARVNAIAVTPSAVYLGGVFSIAGGASRSRLAAFTPAGTLLPWAPAAAGGAVSALVAAPGNKVVAGGQFTTVNGSGNPGYGLAAIDGTTGSLLPWAANSRVRNGGANAGINSLTVDGDSVYATGFVFGAGGNLEGVARMNLDGTLNWVADCHGDSYGTYSRGGAVYAAGHAHYCGNLSGGFAQPTGTWRFYRGMAFSKAATGVARTEYLNYPNWAGTPTPSILQWLPQLDAGTYTGQSQAAWSLAGNADYVVAGGEFPRAGGVAQQGLTRFAAKSAAPDTLGPALTFNNFVPTVTSPASGEALVSWQANYDRDSRNLTYRVIRNNDAANPVYTVAQGSNPWDRPYLSFLDKGLTPGSTVNYRVMAYDSTGNFARSNTVAVTVSGNGSATDAYARAVLADGPQSYWRMNDAAGSTLADFTGRDPMTATANVGRTAQGAIASGGSAAVLPGSGAPMASTRTLQEAPWWYSVEGWFQTSSTTGGRIVGFGGASTATSPNPRYDRMVYMDTRGAINFGTRQGSSNRVLTSAAGLNDGRWHHFVGTVGNDGMGLYVDGVLAGQRTDTHTAGPYSGYWRVGGDNLTGWANAPSNVNFAGNVDEVAIYQQPLTAERVRSHFQAAAGTVANRPPTAGFTSTTTSLDATFDGRGSTDPEDGAVSSYAWDFGDGTTGTGATPAHHYATAGTYSVVLTVADRDGATAKATQDVTVTAPDPGGAVASDTFNRTVSGGWGSADAGGAWTKLTGGTAGPLSVNSGAGVLGMNAAGALPAATLASVSALNSDSVVTATVDKLPNVGLNSVSLGARQLSGTGYRARLRFGADGVATLALVRSTSTTDTVIRSLANAVTLTAGEPVKVRLQVEGSGTTSLRARVWRASDPEPQTWQVTVTDSTAGYQSAGGVYLSSFLSGSATNAPATVSVDDLLVSAL